MAAKKLSGFPEFLPEGRIVEQRVLESLSRTFELHGFGSIETRALETMDSLTRKGEIDKEVYAVKRIHAPADAPAEFGLHFDLTVPFARYVLENAGRLAFPFRRYQIQKAWRGERPQDGRYREFTQADVDIVGQGELAAHHDVELPLVTLDALERLHVDFGIPPATMEVSNRKLSEGFYRGLGLADPMAVLQLVDKLDKIGPDAVRGLLLEELAMPPAAANACLRLASIRAADTSFVDEVRGIGVEHPLLDTGLEELAQVVQTAQQLVPGRLVAALKIARGLDYYTGTVYETSMRGMEAIGSISSGGRYDSLASDQKNSYPGVGLSIGVSRILVPLIGKGALGASRPVPTVVLVAVDSEDARLAANETATRLRSRGIAAEVSPNADKYGKQIRYADRRGIPYVWFSAGEVKDIRTGEQQPADPDSWVPPAADLRPSVVQS
jgi:histidyl-tRNA synthetase